MITQRVLALATAAMLGVVVAPTGAQAATAQVDHGTFSMVTYTPDAGSPTTATAQGTWNVAVRGSTLGPATGTATGTATFNIFVDGVHHVAYGVPNQQITRTRSGWTFSLPTLAGQLTVTLDGSTLTYDIPDYSYGGESYADVTYVGHLNT